MKAKPNPASDNNSQALAGILCGAQRRRAKSSCRLQKCIEHDQLWISGKLLPEDESTFAAKLSIKLMNSGDFENDLLLARGLSRELGTILVVDVANSVRMIDQNETETVVQWVDVFRESSASILPRHNGYLVKSTGDGFIAVFSETRDAFAAAIAIHEWMGERSAHPVSLKLRMGIDSGAFIRGDLDVYGRAVNQTARIASIAHPGEIILSEIAYSQLASGLDGSFIDLGFFNLKGVDKPARLYSAERRVSGAGPLSELPRDLKLTLAVVPFECREPAGAQILGIGDILCEELNRQLAPSPFIRIIARSSTSAFRARSMRPARIAAHFGAHFVVSGSFHSDGGAIELELLFTDAVKDRVVWSQHLRLDLERLIRDDKGLLADAAQSIIEQIENGAIAKVKGQQLVNVANYNLLIAAIALMNRLSQDDFMLAKAALEALAERAPRAAEPRAWLAQWYNMKIQQGWTRDLAADCQAAITCCQAALDRDPESSLALSVSGLIATTIHHDVARGRDLMEQALLNNPSDPVAWLFQGANRMFAGDAGNAIIATRRAIFLTPLDPQRYLYESLLSSAFLVHGDDHAARHHAEQSLKLNALHASTHRVRLIALWRTGLHEEARSVASQLLNIEPGFEVSKWLARTPLHRISQGQEFARILREAGLPN